ncbi:MAG: hypothetical protein M1376_02415 [Planctomycetes bacterium]|nr:hypothetical protein [Planctomycetota bacterium]
MNTPIHLYDPEAILGSRKILDLSEQQVQELRKTARKARQESMSVLTEAQRRRLQPLERKAGGPSTRAWPRREMTEPGWYGRERMDDWRRGERPSWGGAGTSMSRSTWAARNRRMIPFHGNWLDPDLVLMLKNRLDLSDAQVSKLKTVVRVFGWHTRMILTDRQLARLRTFARGWWARSDMAGRPWEPTGVQTGPRRDPPASTQDSRDAYLYYPGSARARLMDEDEGFGDEGFGDDEGFDGDEGFGDEGFGFGLGEGFGDDEGFDEDEGFGDEGFGFGGPFGYEGFGGEEGFPEEGFGEEEGFGRPEGFGGEEGFRDGERFGGGERFEGGFRR